MGMGQEVFNTHNLRIKIPVQKQDMYISDSDNITNSPLEEEDSKTPLCRKPKMGLFIQLYYLFTRCFD